MYDDLFGDLPMAKSATGPSASNNENTSKQKLDDKITNQNAGAQKSTTITDGERIIGFTSTNGDKGVGDKNMSKKAPNRNNPVPHLTSKSKSIVQAIGNAGKTTSFIPLALRRKRNANSNLQSNRKRTVTSTSSITIATRILDKKSKDNDDENGIKTDEQPVNIHEGSSNEINQYASELSLTTLSTAKETTHSGEASSHSNKINNENAALIEENDEDDDYIESEALQKLHSSIHPYDMYDPMEPNDYLAYKKNRKNEIMKRDLEQQAKKTLELQKQLREHIEEERKRVLETGDVDKIIEMESNVMGAGSNGGMGRGGGIGRGRARGLNNLPAWLIKKQKEQQQNDKDTKQHQLNDKNNMGKDCTAVLTNMVGPGEVDDELQDEVREECEMKCGKVIHIKIEETDAAVKVFVTFQNSHDAKKVPAIFHGRMFGRRQISAQLL